MSGHGKITVERRIYLWEVRDKASELFPSAEKVLVIRSVEGRSEFVLGVRAISPTDTCIGPVFIRALEPEIFPSVVIGNYYLFPAFKGETGGGIHGENVRSVVASLLNGRRLRKVNSFGLPLGRGRAEQVAPPTSLPAIRVWHFLIVGAGTAAGMFIAWYVGQAAGSLLSLSIGIVAAVLLTWGVMVWLFHRYTSLLAKRHPGGYHVQRSIPTYRMELGQEKKEQAAMAVKAIPEGYSTATPYLIIKEAARAIDFYKQAFGATEVMRFADPSGKIGHAEIKIGNSVIMLADEHPDMGYRGPQALGGTPVSILLYVPDVDARFRQALAAGAKEMRPVKDQFYGDRSGTLVDPFGHVWTIATHKEDVSLEEVKRRFESFVKQQSKT